MENGIPEPPTEPGLDMAWMEMLMEATTEEQEKLDALSRQVAQADISQVRRVVDAAYALGKQSKIY